MREIIQNTPQNQECGQKTVCFVKKKGQNMYDRNQSLGTFIASFRCKDSKNIWTFQNFTDEKIK